jgi:hypothetical protein
MTALHSSNINLKKNEDTASVGIAQEHQKTNDYSTELLLRYRNSCVETLLQSLTPTASSDYSLWKTTKKLKQIMKSSPPLRTPHGTWARRATEKAHAFSQHLASVFHPYPSSSTPVAEETILKLLQTPCQLEPPIPRLIRTDIQTAIKHLNPKKSLGYDLIKGQILKELPIIDTKYLTQLFNAILLLNYFPTQWKVAQIILILKPGKPPHDLSSYRPISLLPIVSKLFETLLLKRLLPLIEHNKLIPPHQFGFRWRHSTIKQTHRIVHRIEEAFEHKEYCSAAFLDISQAFDKAWHTGLLYKLRQSLPLNYFLLLQSYLHSRHFFDKIASAHHTVSNPRWRTLRQCPRTVVIPHVHCRPSNLPNNHSHICR